MVLQCRNCRTSYANAIAADSGAEEFGEEYYRGGAYSDYLADEPAVRRTARRRLGVLERLVTGRTLLDVGCATGFFVQAARERHWDAHGIEVSPYASEQARARGMPVVTASISDPPLSARFDAVTMWDTIEHLDDPLRALVTVRGLLNSEGILALSTGDIGSRFSRLSGARWRLFADPTHRVFFDEQTLSALLRLAGYHVVRVTRPGKWVSTAMILHHTNWPPAVMLARWCAATALNVPLYVNLGDVMTVIARPASSIRFASTSYRPRPRFLFARCARNHALNGF